MTTYTLPANAPDSRAKRTGQIVAEVAALPADKAFVVTVKGETRSDRQRRYWFAVVVPTIRDHARDHHGIDKGKDTWHEYLKGRFITATVDRIGKTDVTVRPSTSDLSRAEFVQLVDEIQAWAATELDCIIPDPDPEWRQKRMAKVAQQPEVA